jgi:uncharacterized protein
MSIFAKNEPLTESDLDHLGRFLMNCKGGKAMNIEELDGFFAALIVGPEIILPSEYMPEVFGSETPETYQFESLEEANEILGLMMRHWNDIAGTLSKGKVYFPLLQLDENGEENGNDWARGFIRGTRMRQDGWVELLADEDHGGCMIPMMMLYHQHDEDPSMRPEPIGPEQRKKVISSMAASLVEAHLYFRQDGQPQVSTLRPEPQHANVKIGRNDPCPCGSGKKFKRCCGGATIH